MGTEILKWLKDYNTELFCATVLIVIVWIVARFYFVRFHGIEKTVKKLEESSDCKTHNALLTDHKELLKGHSESIHKLLLGMTRIEAVLNANSPMGESFSVAKSPRQLNESGEQLYNDSGAKLMIENNLDFFIQKIEEKTPGTALDVENYAFNVLLVEMETEKFNDIKNYVFNNPEFNGKSISVHIICFICSFPLRNEYLKRHPELTEDSGSGA